MPSAESIKDGFAGEMELSFTTEDMNNFAVNIIKDQGMNYHQIESYNNLMREGMKQILKDLFLLKETVELNNKFNDNVNSVVLTLSFDEIKINKPSNPLKNIMLVPSYARKNDSTYSLEVVFDIICNFVVNLNNGTSQTIKKVIPEKSFELPCMVKSECCNLYGMNLLELDASGEDSCDIGGYFIISGKEWIIDLMESKLFNSCHTYDTTGHENEITRSEIISKPGDGYAHSSEIIIRIRRNGDIDITFNSHSYLKLIPIPFYLIYKLLEVFIDKNIIDLITSFTNDVNLKTKIAYVLTTAFNAPNPIFNKAKDIIEIDVLLTTMAECIANPTHAEVVDAKTAKYIKTFSKTLLIITNTLLLPHMGKTPESRPNKLYFLSYMIYKTILVNLKIAKPTDRDSYINKRIITTGHSIAKELKSVFNLTVARPIMNRIMEELRKNSVFQMSPLNVLLSSIIKMQKLSSIITKSIVTGQKEIKISNSVTTQNKIPSEQLIRKNNLNSIASQRTLRSPTAGASKSSERSYSMRQIHETQIGGICFIQSQDTGESVGIVKQLASGAIVSLSQNSTEFEQLVYNDEMVIPLEEINVLLIEEFGFSKIFINGKIVGVTATPSMVVMKYREYRRGFNYDPKTKQFVQLNAHKISPYTTIIWEFTTNNIYFWLDHGRLLKPYPIVRNNSPLVEHPSIIDIYFKNVKHYECKPTDVFSQRVVLRKSDFNYTLKTLLQNGIIEYLAPGELDNMLISVDINNFYKNRSNPLLQYTHVNIPFLDIGFPGLNCVFETHNQAPRLTFQTNQTKQTIGVPTLKLEYFTHKHGFIYETMQMPLVKTVYNDLIYPNGVNIIEAIMCFKDNQEDSLIVNGTATERTLFHSVEYSYIKEVLENTNEVCGIVNSGNINANYKKLNGNYCVSKYTLVEQNDVMLATYIKLPNNEFKNTSRIYRGSEAIVIEDVIKGKTQDGYEYYKFKYYIPRRCSIGDKFSTRHGQKGSISSILPYYLLPFTWDCICPDVIMNPFAIPSRMTIGQLLEGVSAKLAALEGRFIDGTIYQPFNMKETRNALERFGYDEWGNEELYDGLYGHPIQNKIFMTPVTIQKLQKFATLEQQATSTGPQSIITKQPLDGKANDGGLRYGEMEKDVAISSGGMYFLLEKLRDNSDGYYIYICMNCKKFATVNEDKKIYYCNFCPGTPNIFKVYTSWMTKTVIHHLESSGIGVKIYPEEIEL